MYSCSHECNNLIFDIKLLSTEFLLIFMKILLSPFRMAGDGVLICSIDNLPAQLPREATDYFGKLLLPWLPEMVIEEDINSII